MTRVHIKPGKYKSGRKYWIVDTLYPDGRRERLFFRDEREAEAEAEKRRRESFDASLIPEALKFEAAECDEILHPHGWTIRRATEYVTQHVLPYAQKPIIAEAVNKFLADEEALKLKDVTLTDLRYRLRPFVARFGDQRLHELSLEDFAEWMHELLDDGYEPQGVRHFLNKASSFIHWAVPRGYCAVNLLSALRRPKLIWKKPCVFTAQEVDLLFRLAQEHDLLTWAVLGVLCGIRPHELRRISRNAVRLTDSFIVIESEESKTSERRVLELEGAWGHCVAAWWEVCDSTKPIVPWPERKHVEALHNELGKWGHDIMRHTAASAHFAFFQDAGKTRKTLGHVGDPRVFDSHYKALMTRAGAAAIYALRPS